MPLIPLTQGLHAQVSEGDFERVNAFKWYASLESRGTKYYAIRRERIGGKRYKIRMHRFVLGAAPFALSESDLVVDHLNGDSLDNRRENLELITQDENMKRSRGWKKKITSESTPSL